MQLQENVDHQTQNMRTISTTELQGLNTLGLQANCPDVCLISDPEELLAHLRALSPEERRMLHIAGELSNTVLGDVSDPLLLFRDGDVIDLTSHEDGTLVQVAGSCRFDSLVEFLCDQGVAGLELLSGIPGTVGSGIVQNIAAYGQRLSDRFLSARAFDLDSSSIVHLDANAMNFSYRSSWLKDTKRYTPTLIILDAVFRFPVRGVLDPITYADLRTHHCESGRAPEDLHGRRASVQEVRERKGMVIDGNNWVPSAGSFFMSPIVPTKKALEIAALIRGSQFAENFLSWYKPDVRETRCPAALVMRAAGFLNGDRWGSVGLSPHHILALCRFSRATASDVAAVANVVQAKVAKTFALSLQAEVRYAGAIAIPNMETFLAQNPFSSGVGEPQWVLGVG